MNSGNLTRDGFLAKLVKKSGYPIPLNELKTACPRVILDADYGSCGQVIELECCYNIQFTGIDFDRLDFSFCGRNDDEGEEWKSDISGFVIAVCAPEARGELLAVQSQLADHCDFSLPDHMQIRKIPLRQIPFRNRADLSRFTAPDWEEIRRRYPEVKL